MSDLLLETVKKYWGYDTLRPLQREAMTAAIEKRDSLVIMPTGGGKSLCYQTPALLSDSLTVVVSPLISLMKDQVDRLLSRGVPAAFVNSSLDAADKSRVQAGVARGEYRMIF
ncbi:MAG TPA: DEAD/DEAH box helicase, partial [Planctomycetota bacterium]|nr:DEAD/DEAH box helicase [Planctomycetota bacterium]